MEFERNEITPEYRDRLESLMKKHKKILKEIRKTIQEAEDELGRLGKEDK